MKIFKLAFAVFLIILFHLNSNAATQFSLKQENTLSVKSLHEKEQPTGAPSLRIAYFNTRQGLLGIYESADGKRVLFRSKYTARGNLVATALHYNPDHRKIEQLIDMRPSTRVAQGGINVAGVELSRALKEGAKNNKFDPKQQKKLKNNMGSIANETLMDGIAALYLHLDQIDNKPELSKLIAIFGASRTAIELITGHYNGIENLIAASDESKVKLLSQGCLKGKCLYNGNKFVVHRSGFFDVLSAQKSNVKTKFSKQVSCINNSNNQKAGFKIAGAEDDNNDCHGMCGPGCFNPGNISTPECLGHDNCVQEYGHLQCIFSVPEGCVECNSLVEAIISYLGALFGGGNNGKDEDSIPNEWWDAQ
ncbi:hypothetical protein [Undibacterium luofuense]|uniref:hypothetical protein n=1 Tax=Undibacterium luofuense TaxID=2828733 RepID=UPI0030ED83B3